MPRRSSAIPSSTASIAAWKRTARAFAARATGWCSTPRAISSSISSNRAGAQSPPGNERCLARGAGAHAGDRRHPALHSAAHLARCVSRPHRAFRRAASLRGPHVDGDRPGRPLLRDMTRRWLLPEHIEDVLPGEARAMERLRRTILDLFEAERYQLVAPPLLEYTDSLLSGIGRDPDLATFKLVDQLSGRMMGVRADHTPQVARIDAHLLNRQGVARLCYCGSVLHTVPAGMTKMREPIQIGAELYGHAGLEADAEILGLMISGLQAAGIEGIHIHPGQPNICRAPAEGRRPEPAGPEPLFHAVQQKDAPAAGELGGPAV